MIHSFDKVATFCLLALLGVSAAAQEKAGEISTEPSVAGIQPDDEIIDEVTVLGVRELADLRAEVVLAEDAVYVLFNDLNDDDRYDIVCKKETRIGSQIPKRICQARLYRDAVAAEAEAVTDGEIMPGMKVNSTKHNAILREKMAALANEHPELLAALKKRLELSRKFERERAKRFD